MIRLVNLSKYYYGNNSVALGLRKINLEFHKGEFVAITGESGSGKTTLLSTISGMLPFEEGEMYFCGNATSYYDEADWEEYRKNHIAFVFQNYNLVDSYTALENVMTSFLIQEVEEETAKKKSMELLERVGIADYATHRATELSSGQKQRLSIARALAKNTEVIVADEPTGNLDSENGRQIMELFEELSKEKLVLVVTHNYEEAAPFVTRKIVVHDGEIEEDIQIRETVITKTDNSWKPQKRLRKEFLFSKTAWIFACMNMKSNKGKSALLVGFLCLVCVASFLFLGNFIANLDDTDTKIQQKSSFMNLSKNRIAVRHPDGSEMTEDDFLFLDGLKYVIYTEKYGLVNDINYFSEKGVDYQVTYVDDRLGLSDSLDYKEEVTLDSFTKYVYSVADLTQEDLRCGTLPNTTNEVVLYAKDESLLGSTFVCYFHNKSDWSKNAFIRMEMTVSGILKHPTEQYYFSEKLCRVLNNDAMLQVMAYRFEGKGNVWQDTIFYMDDTLGLEGETIAAHSEVQERYGSYDTRYKIYNELELGFKKYEQDQDTTILHVDHSEVLRPIVTKVHKSTKSFMALSDELYTQLFKDVKNTQMSVWIEDYAYTEDVLKIIQKAGYEAAIPYQVGSITYDEEKVKEQLITLCLSTIALFVLFALEILIVSAFMRNEKNADLVLKSIGMEQSILTKIKVYTLLSYLAIAFVVTLILVFFVGRWIPPIYNILIYYRYYHVVLLLVLGVVAMLLTAFSYRRYLVRMLRAGSEVKVS